MELLYGATPSAVRDLTNASNKDLWRYSTMREYARRNDREDSSRRNNYWRGVRDRRQEKIAHSRVYLRDDIYETTPSLSRSLDTAVTRLSNVLEGIIGRRTMTLLRAMRHYPRDYYHYLFGHDPRHYSEEI